MHTIEYEYPDLGRVEILLHNESAEIYQFMKKHKGGIEYFEKLDQLGALREVHKSAHHSKWEYMVMQMHLIRQLKVSEAFGFSTDIKLTKDFSVSSIEELLKSWVFLTNYGHLLDTLEAERVWLELLLDEDNLRNAFINCMPDDISRQFAEQVLRDEDLFNLHYILAIVMLAHGKGGATSKDLFWIEMIKALLRYKLGINTPKESSKLHRASTIFDRIRKVSYVLLDMNKSALFLRIDTNNLIRNLLNKPDELLYDPESEMNKSLEAIERLLFSEVYANQQVCKFKHAYILKQKNRFHELTVKHGINLFCQNQKTFSIQLHQHKNSNFGKGKLLPEMNHLCRLNLLSPEPFQRNTCQFYSEQKRLSQASNTKVKFLVTPAPFSVSGSILDVFVTEKLNASELSNLYYHLLKYSIECYKGWMVDDGLFGWAAGDSLQALFNRMLSNYIDVSLKMRFLSGTSPTDYHVDCVMPDLKWSEWRTSYSEGIRDLITSRKWEAKSLLKLFTRKKGEFNLIALSNIHLYNLEGIQKVEWDGAFFNLKEDEVTLYLLEAKRRKSRHSDEGKNDLIESINKAGIKLKHGHLKIIKCTGYAYTSISLKDIIITP